MFEEYPEMMSPKEAMKALGISKNTMYKRIKTGEIKSTKVGKKLIRIRRKELANYVERSSKQTKLQLNNGEEPDKHNTTCLSGFYFIYERRCK